MGHAKCLLSIDEQKQKKFVDLIIKNGLSVRKLEILLKAPEMQPISHSQLSNQCKGPCLNAASSWAGIERCVRVRRACVRVGCVGARVWLSVRGACAVRLTKSPSQAASQIPRQPLPRSSCYG